ncbi:MAG: OFA family MFS transporter [Candidatus Nezhaarchaeota archaeon]|nr:OFA family MFS transporter [Candidatus Nezhaarchaeota archaeon]MCX8142429.1 OFA family MFS transporter [Candidatus Nezhaarchaeota archaeon]MDW8050598.1 OFA family MFS transporter [Nitrososphaerota archaeon]
MSSLSVKVSRWVFVIASLAIMLCLGAVYAYSVIRVHFEKIFEGYGLKVTATEMQLPLMVSLLLSVPTMPLIGKYVERHGPRRMALISAIMVGSSWLLASFANNPLTLILSYGVIGGIGGSIAYNCAIVVPARWFPDKRGLVVGLTVLGLGISAAIVGPLADYIAMCLGPQIMLRVLGIMFFAIMVISASSLRFPPSDWSPSKQDSLRLQKVVMSMDLSREEMIRTHTFYALWICFMIGSLSGLMAIGTSKQVGLEVATNIGMSEQEASPMLTALTALFATCNALGRPFFGWLTDKLTPKRVAMISFMLIFVASALMFMSQTSLQAYTLTFAILWFNLGGWLAIAPASTAFFFGIRDYARNYGLVFTAYGVGAFTGNLMAGCAKDLLGSYISVFPILAMLSILGVIVARCLNPPLKP